VTTSIKTCRSERKAEDNQQVVSNADRLLAPSLSPLTPLSSRFGTICHNYYCVFMTPGRLPWAHRTRLQQLLLLVLTNNVFNKSGNLFSLKANPNAMKTSYSRTVRAQSADRFRSLAGPEWLWTRSCGGSRLVQATNRAYGSTRNTGADFRNSKRKDRTRHSVV